MIILPNYFIKHITIVERLKEKVKIMWVCMNWQLEVYIHKQHTVIMNYRLRYSEIIGSIETNRTELEYIIKAHNELLDDIRMLNSILDYINNPLGDLSWVMNKKVLGKRKSKK